MLERLIVGSFLLLSMSVFAQPSMVPEPPADLAQIPSDARQEITGLATKTIRAGTGATRPTSDSIVTVHYTGWQANGKLIESSHARGVPATFPLNQVIPGWRQGVELMVEGEVRRLWIPERLAYQGKGPGPKGMLVFDIELISFEEPPRAPEAPADVAEIPMDATISASGLASKRLQAGTGKQYPSAEQSVRVHYTGWTTDGKMFDSSVSRGKPTEFALTQVIRGWTEGLQLMVVGEKRRFWIPQKLAYQGQPGKPKGMLVFDVELLGID